MKSNPLISILLAVRNCEKFIPDTISSVIEQTYKEWELIIVCNGCSDNTFDISSKFALKHPNIKVYEIDQSGKNLAYNFAFKHSYGQYICFLAGDDCLTSRSLEERVKPLGHKLQYSTIRLKTFSKNHKYHNLVMPKRKNLPNYSGGSVFFSRYLAKKIFPIPRSLPNEDTWASLFLRAFGENVHINDELYLYRIHNDNSFGYSLSLSEKKKAYLDRMEAFIIFHDLFYNSNNIFIKSDVKNIANAVSVYKKDGFKKVLFSSKTPIKMKLIFAMYSSHILYNLRNVFFRLFSGIMNQL